MFHVTIDSLKCLSRWIIAGTGREKEREKRSTKQLNETSEWAKTLFTDERTDRQSVTTVLFKHLSFQSILFIEQGVRK